MTRLTASLVLGALTIASLLLLAAHAPLVRGESISIELSLDPYVTLSGAKSEITERAYHRITDRAAWVKLWLRHVGVAPEKHSEYYNRAGVPDVDFECCFVIAVFQGKSTNSAGVIAVESVDADGIVRFRFDDRSYQTMNGADACAPFGFFVVPRMLVARTLILEENVQGTIGKPPVWKERARYDE